MKFKYNYQNNTLAYQKEFDLETWYELGEEQFPGNFNSQGFKLDSGWITFTVYKDKIQAFSKQSKNGQTTEDFWEPQTIIYYRKYLNKECPVIFEFTPQDEVEKIGGKWVKKGGQHE